MTDSAPPRRAKRWSLRTRLVVSIVALLAAASVIVGLVSVLALQGFLMDRLDRQLTAATGRSEVAIDGDFGGELVPPVPGIGGDLPRVGVQGPFTITAEVYGGLILAGVINEEGYLEGLTPAQSRLLATVPADGEPATLSLGGRLGDYRVAANQFAGGRVVVTGLPLSDVQAVVMQLIVVVAVVTALVLAAAVVGGIVVVRAALRPLERVAATAAQVARLPLDRGEVALAVRVPDFDADPRTEVGQVGAAFNRMLGHVASALTARQASENKVRRFVADASHELRTPLASIRGYAELTRRGNHELPPDVVHSLGRVESEAKRMTSLVEDLLLLARLDEGQSLEREPVDLSLLLIDAVSDAHAAGPNHVWSLDLPERPVIVEGDRGRLHQVVVNLLANARVHTPPRTSVAVALTVEEASAQEYRAVLTVADDGPGIPESVQPVLFERFARGDGSRSREAGSTGLGLALVKAVVDKHGGAVSVGSEPGKTAFRVELPLPAVVKASALL